MDFTNNLVNQPGVNGKLRIFSDFFENLIIALEIGHVDRLLERNEYAKARLLPWDR